MEKRSNLTRSQFLIWTGQQLSPELPIYNMGWRFGLGVDVEPDRFATAFAELAQACDTLRMVFDLVDDAPNYVVGDGPAGRHQSLVLQSAEHEATIEKLIRTPFDLSKETFRSALLRIDDSRWEWVLVQHHLTTDAASGEILLRQLSDRYLRQTSGPDDATPTLPAFADWITKSGAGPDPDDGAFWSAKIRNLPPPETPYQMAGRTRSAQTHRLSLELGATRLSKLQAILQTDRFAALTPHQAQFNLLATVVFAWLHRVTQAETPVVGLATHGRSTKAARDTPGLFMEVLPLDAEILPDMALAALHAQLAETSIAALMHASPGTSTSEGHARFNVVLNYIRTAFDGFGGAPVSAEWLDHGFFDPAHALWIDLFQLSERDTLSLNLRFNSGLFPEALRKRAADHILRILDAMLADPDQVLQDIPLADDADQSMALTRDQRPLAVEAPGDLLDALDAHCRAEPARVAIHDEEHSFSRADLAAQSDGIAQFLVGSGVDPGDRVGIFMTRGVELVAAMLGVLKAGAAYVPLDPLQPLSRLQAIAKEANLALTLTETRLSDRARDLGALALVDALDAKVSGPLPDRVDPAADAYVIFTSGSTGRPKGVRISRRALSRYADWAARTYAPGGPADWALHSAIGFDLTVTSIFAPLVSGGVIRAYRETLDSPDLSILHVFQDDQVDVVKLTPAHLALAVRDGTPTRRIRTLILGGDNLSTRLAQDALETFGPEVSIFNEYGPTEATVGCMVHQFDPARDTGQSVPIGRPAEATGIYVLDHGLNPVPDHVTGMLFIAGPDRLSEGYLGLEAETARQFIGNPFLPGSQMYRSGDVAHVDETGVIHYHGRADDQIKIGSIRVELGEIRNAVLSHPAVADCAVVYGAEPPEAPQRCSNCGLGSDHPDAEIDGSGQCRLCRDFATYQQNANGYFRSMTDLRAILAQAAETTAAKYDCLMLLSGGKDSTYALGRLMELTPRVLAVTLENGFISQGARRNIERVCKTLNVDHRFISTPHMNEIFADSLDRHANVCNGCFKTIYTLGMQLARQEGINLIVTGLSRGQLFETRLAPELFKENAVSPDQIDRNITEARRFYHRVPDAASRLLNGEFFDDDKIFDTISFVDFYRYCDVTVDEIYAYLDQKVPWLRPTDTGRSSNCLINDLGIYIHKKRRGYHNYALPYSWDVRTGHKTRNAALAELDDELDEDRMRDLMQQIGYDPDQRGDDMQPGLRCYVVERPGLTVDDLRAHLASQLPRDMIPSSIVSVSEIPLTPNGKVDHAALSKLGRRAKQAQKATARAPANSTEATLLDIWQIVLDRDDFGTSDNFFEIGGDSVHAISIASRASRAGLPVTALSILTGQTVSVVANELASAQGGATARPTRRASLDEKSLAHLGTLFGKRPDG